MHRCKAPFGVNSAPIRVREGGELQGGVTMKVKAKVYNTF